MSSPVQFSICTSEVAQTVYDRFALATVHAADGTSENKVRMKALFPKPFSLTKEIDLATRSICSFHEYGNFDPDLLEKIETAMKSLKNLFPDLQTMKVEIASPFRPCTTPYPSSSPDPDQFANE